MHGFIMSELRQYVSTRLGAEGWRALLEKAGLGSREYLSFEAYPDDEVVALVVAASEVTQLEVQAVLEDFGEFIAGDLVRIFRPIIDPQWKLLDFLEHAESSIHQVVKARNTRTVPPVLDCARLAPDHLVMRYNSRRKLCAVAKGILRGAAKHYRERIEVFEETCMHRGDDLCRIHVYLVQNGGAAAKQGG